MPLDEIEVPGTSYTLRCLTFRTDHREILFSKMLGEENQFSMDTENPGKNDGLYRP